MICVASAIVRMPPPTGERHENLLGHLLDHFEQDGPAFMTRGNVEKDQLIGAVRFIAARDFDRVARIAKADEMNALHHAAAIDVQARDDELW